MLNNLENLTSGSWDASAFGKSGSKTGSSLKSGTSEDEDERGASIVSNESIYDEKEEHGTSILF